jgi:tRNA (guanine-N7-)-methyltransferase
MAKRKLERFAAIETFSNVFQHVQTSQQINDLEQKGTWKATVFKNEHPLVLELGCGKGEYTVGMSRAEKNKNFLGLDLKGNRIWPGAKTALDENIKNAAFLRCRIENIEKAFAANEVDEIWITFPDPQPQKTRERKRLTAPGFLNRYKNILKPNGKIHLKTDSFSLYTYTLEVIKEMGAELIYETSDLYNSTVPSSINEPSLKTIQTHYENLFASKGFKICYIQFKIN